MFKKLSFLSPYWLWVLLAIPAYGILFDAMTSDSPRIIHRLVHPTGEFAARFMIIAMMATPLAMLFNGWRGPCWLVKNRRYFGVAAFGYAALHTIFYLMDTATLERIIREATQLDMWTGWVAFLIFIPLTVTSMDYFVRKMGPAWKSLQRWTYAAAVLTLIHWAALHNWRSPEAAIIHFAPLALLTIYRLWSNWSRKRKRRASKLANA